MSKTDIDLRAAMSLYPTGVCVITAETQRHAAFGMTVNSFTSLSLEPPLIMWNLQKSSDTFRAWRDADLFAVNILTIDQQGLSSRFAQNGDHDLNTGEIKRGSSGCPGLVNSLATLECKMHARYEEGDHVIMIGEVVGIESDPDAVPLTYLRGKYGTVRSG